MGITQEVVSFVARTKYPDLPSEVIRLAEGFILDNLGVALAGSTEEGSRIVQEHIHKMGGRREATILGCGWKAPLAKAALANGVAAHAMDYDDTQLSTSKDAVYGLLTHPTTPVLATALALAEKREATGRDLLLAYVLGVEVECRVADAIHPRHYQSGFHSTATIGSLGAVVATGKLLGLSEAALARALGMAASMASGLRENFGTMTKPLHAGRAAENGVTAALLAQAGHTAAANILEAPRGFFNAMAGGYEPGKIAGRLGRPYFMVDPGISIKPYPSGSLSHPAQDLILDLVHKHDLKADDIDQIDVGTNSNVLNALIHPAPTNALEGKFSIPFCMAIAVLERNAGIAQFTDRKVRDPKVVRLMQRVKLHVDQELETLGYDRVRSRIRIRCRDGREIEGRCDVARGHPEKPMSWGELSDKFRDCAGLVLSPRRIEAAIERVTRLKDGGGVAPLIRAIGAGRPRSRAMGARPGDS